MHFRDVGEKRLLLAWAPLTEGGSLTGHAGFGAGSRWRRSISSSPLFAPTSLISDW